MLPNIVLRVAASPTFPWFVVEEATTTASHPAGKAPGRNPIPDPIPFLFLHRRSAELQISQSERPLHEFDVTDLAIVRTCTRAIPVAGVLDHHQRPVVTHDRSDRTVPKQVGQADVDEGPPGCHRITPSLGQPVAQHPASNVVSSSARAYESRPLRCRATYCTPCRERGNAGLDGHFGNARPHRATP